MPAYLIPHLSIGLRTAYIVVAGDLLSIAFIRYKFINMPLIKMILQVIVGGAIVLLIGL